MINERSVGCIADQRVISSIVRLQPPHTPDAASMMHSLTQGD